MYESLLFSFCACGIEGIQQKVFLAQLGLCVPFESCEGAFTQHTFTHHGLPFGAGAAVERSTRWYAAFSVTSR